MFSGTRCLGRTNARRRRAEARPSRLLVEPLELRDLPSGLAAASTPAYGQIPLSFEANQGQTDGRVQYLAHGPGYTLFLTPTAATLELARSTPATGTVLDMQLVGARPDTPARGLAEQGGTANYLIGNEPGGWHANVPTFGRVQYAGVYPGIDLVYSGSQQQLEYDFDVAPGADPGAITLSFPGAAEMDLDAAGDLVLHTAGGDVVQHAPVVYQDGPGGRQAVAGRYVLAGDGRVRFGLGPYDPTHALVIDPTLAYSTYLGGNALDEGRAIAVDAAGEAYLTGYTMSTNFPTTPGAFETQPAGTADVFVGKLNDSGTALVYATYLGGSGADEGWGIAVNAAGNAFITGDTTSRDFPTTRTAFQRQPGGGVSSAFVAELNATGSALVYSTYLGGSRDDHGRGIALNSAGRALVAGYTASPDFPTTAGVFQTRLAGGTNAFVVQLNAAGTGLVYGTYLGGGANDYAYAIAVGTAGNAFITGAATSGNFPTTAGVVQGTPAGGTDAFVAKLNATGTALTYATYLGGSGNDEGTAVAVDSGGRAFVTGDTNSADFPTTRRAFQSQPAGGYDAFVTELNAAGAVLTYSTYLGGSADDFGTGIALDAAGQAYVIGDTLSGDFPTTADATQPTAQGRQDAFVVELSAGGAALAYATYLGGSADDFGTGIAVDAAANAYVVGYTSSANFPTTPGAVQTRRGSAPDAFVAEVSSADPAVQFQVTVSNATPVAGTAFTLTVTALDASGLPATGYRGTVHFTADDGAATLPDDYTFTAADRGTYTVDGVVLRTAGGQTITATDTAADGLSGAADLIVASAPAAVLSLTTNVASVTAGHTVRLTVAALDPYGNVATGYRGRITFASSDPQSTLPADFLFRAATNGVHTFTAVRLETAGGQVISATDPVHPSIAGTAALTVRPAPVSGFLVTGFPSPVTAGEAGLVLVTAQDAFGNTVPGYRGTVHLTSSDPQAVLDPDHTFTQRDAGHATFHATLRTAGTQVLTAVDQVNDALTGAQTDILVAATAADHFQVQAPARVRAGVPFTVTVAALDPYGNVDVQYLGQLSWSTTDPDGGVELPPPYTFTAEDAGVRRFVQGVALFTGGDQGLTATGAASEITGTATVRVIPAAGRNGGDRGLGVIRLTVGPPAVEVAPAAGDEPPVGDGGLSGRIPAAALQGSVGRPGTPVDSPHLGTPDEAFSGLESNPLPVAFPDDLTAGMDSLSGEKVRRGSNRAWRRD